MGFITIVGGGGFITKFFWMLIAVLTLGVDGKLAVRDDATYNVSVSEAAANDMEADDFENIDTMSMMQLKEKVAKQQAVIDAQKQELSDRAAEVRILQADHDRLEDTLDKYDIQFGYAAGMNRTCAEIESAKCQKCGNHEYAGHGGCGMLKLATYTPETCAKYYEWAVFQMSMPPRIGWRICTTDANKVKKGVHKSCTGSGDTCGSGDD